MDSTDPILDCITVAVLPDDLTNACTAACEREAVGGCTYLPDEPAATEAGTTFEPFVVPDRDPEVRELPDTPLQFFQLFVPKILVESWVKWTNESKIPGPAGPPQEHSRKLTWTSTSVAEVYLYLGILIYMRIHKEATIESYWEASSEDRNAKHSFCRFITRDRFEILSRRLRIFNPALFEDERQRQRQQQQRQPGDNMPRLTVRLMSGRRISKMSLHNSTSLVAVLR